MDDLAEWGDRLGGPEVFNNLSEPVQIALLLGALALLPALLVTMTCFTRVIIVLSFVRQGLAAQSVPPNSVLIGLSIFLTMFIMRPTLDKIGDDALTPYRAGEITGTQAVRNAGEALKDFMLAQTRKADLQLFVHLSGDESIAEPKQTPFLTLVPAFVISELKTAFIMGFCIYLPFLMVDLVVSSLLTSMGMVLMPPALISTPVKILLFVLADGWHLVTRAVVASFA